MNCNKGTVVVVVVVVVVLRTAWSHVFIADLNTIRHLNVELKLFQLCKWNNMHSTIHNLQTFGHISFYK